MGDFEKINNNPRFRAYDIISRAVEEGVAYGWNRAHKHTDDPDRNHALEILENAVMNALCEVLEF